VSCLSGSHGGDTSTRRLRYRLPAVMKISPFQDKKILVYLIEGNKQLQ
jgi:hypothetical protein